MNWYHQAKEVFRVSKPDQFTKYKHCKECAEHEETLQKSSIDTIGLDELGNPGWDPICFCNNEGKKYYMPAFIRLSLETIEGEFYLAQLFFHLESNGKANEFFKSCNEAQRAFIVSFVEYIINQFPDALERNICENEAFKVYGIWSNAQLSAALAVQKGRCRY